MLVYIFLWAPFVLAIVIINGSFYRSPPRRNSNYRVVTDRYSGFSAQYRNWFSPFWHQCGTDTSYKTTNTFRIKKEAFDLIQKYKNGYRIDGKFVSEVVVED